MNDAFDWPKLEILRSITYLINHRAKNSDSLAQFLDYKIGALLPSEFCTDIGPGSMSILLRVLNNALPATFITDEDAALYLAYEDLSANTPNFDYAAFSRLLNATSPEAYLQGFYDTISKTYADNGLTLAARPDIAIVERYPQPFSHLQGMALAPDDTDQARYKIPNTIFFRKDRFSPFPSPIVLAHELVHKFIRDEGLLARGLEEGISEFFCYFIAGPAILPEIVTKNFLIAKRISPERRSLLPQLYLAYLRQAVWIYKTFGIRGIAAAVNKGRNYIKQIETEIANRGSSSSAVIDLPRSEPDPTILARAESLAYLFPADEVVSARAFYLATSYSETQRLDRLSSPYDEALQEIERNVYGVIIGPDGTIEFEDFKTLGGNQTFRYALPVPMP